MVVTYYRRAPKSGRYVTVKSHSRRSKRVKIQTEDGGKEEGILYYPQTQTYPTAAYPGGPLTGRKNVTQKPDRGDIGYPPDDTDLVQKTQNIIVKKGRKKVMVKRTTLGRR